MVSELMYPSTAYHRVRSSTLLMATYVRSTYHLARAGRVVAELILYFHDP